MAKQPIIPDPVVSIIMPCYNAEAFLHQAINSMLGQTFRSFELIIVDDCSTDSSARIIRQLSAKDSRIIYHKNETNRGVAESLNTGIRMAKGEFIARMDADDVSLPERLELQVEHMKRNPSCEACGTDIIIIDEKGDRIGSREYYYTDENIKRNIHRASCFAHPTVMLRRETLIENNLFYSTRLRWVEDYDLWFRLSGYGEFSNLKKYLFNYRFSSSSVKNTHCKESLRNTIRLKLMNMSHATFLSCFILCAEIVLLCLPKRLILFLFESRYRNKKSGTASLQE